MTQGNTTPTKRRVLNAIAPKQKSNGEHVDELIAEYDRLNAKAEGVIEDFIENVMKPRTPGVPVGVLRQCAFSTRAGLTPNISEELRLLKKMAADYA
jgi:hypothetical protein